MNANKLAGSALILGLGLAICCAEPMGTAFTYQGYLSQTACGAQVPDGLYDLQFTLYNVPTGPAAPVAGPIRSNAVPVTNGLFTIRVDFAVSPFDGTRYWLETGVQTNDPGSSFDLLVPWQELTPAPYALFASNAPWSGLTGVPAGFADGVDNEGGVTYTAGPGLVLASTEFSADFLGSGLANKVARSDHTHTGPIGVGSDADLLDGRDSVFFWQLGGNTIGAGNFLGTSNDLPLVLKVNSLPGFRLESGSSGNPNVIGGSSHTVIASDASTIAGGSANIILSNYDATIGGGRGNTSDRARHSVIGGGQNNTLQHNAFYTVIGGGSQNCISNYALYSTIGGGYMNTNQDTALSGTISGGALNTIGTLADNATIGGGRRNLILTRADCATIAGGSNNVAGAVASATGGGQQNTNGADQATIGGGLRNTIVSGEYSTIAGGVSNYIHAGIATIGGGRQNVAAAINATVAGGRDNRAEDEHATIGGGYDNRISTNVVWNSVEWVTNSGKWAVIGGGNGNRAHGEKAVVAGGDANKAYANHSFIGGGQLNQTGDPYVQSGILWGSVVGGGSDNVAQGHLTVVAGGQWNQAQSPFAVVGGGEDNRATREYAVIPGGGKARATHYGQMAFASGAFSTAGDAQSSTFVVRGSTVGDAGISLYLDGGSERMVIPPNSTWSFEALVVGRGSIIPYSAGFVVRGVVARDSISTGDGWDTHIVGTPTVQILGRDHAELTASVVADNVNEALVVYVSGKSDIMRWVATVRTTEVSW